MLTEWFSLGERIKRRLIRVLDILSILFCDLIVIGIGYGVIRLARLLSGPESKFFNIARQLSEAAFLILYVIMVFIDCWEFLMRESRENGTS